MRNIQAEQVHRHVWPGEGPTFYHRNFGDEPIPLTLKNCRCVPQYLECILLANMTNHFVPRINVTNRLPDRYLHRHCEILFVKHKQFVAWMRLKTARRSVDLNQFLQFSRDVFLPMKVFHFTNSFHEQVQNVRYNSSRLYTCYSIMSLSYSLLIDIEPQLHKKGG